MMAYGKTKPEKVRNYVLSLFFLIRCRGTHKKKKWKYKEEQKENFGCFENFGIFMRGMFNV